MSSNSKIIEILNKFFSKTNKEKARKIFDNKCLATDRRGQGENIEFVNGKWMRPGGGYNRKKEIREITTYPY